jgi:hypothetical protein
LSFSQKLVLPPTLEEGGGQKKNKEKHPTESSTLATSSFNKTLQQSTKNHLKGQIVVCC